MEILWAECFRTGVQLPPPPPLILFNFNNFTPLKRVKKLIIFIWFLYNTPAPWKRINQTATFFCRRKIKKAHPLIWANRPSFMLIQFTFLATIPKHPFAEVNISYLFLTLKRKKVNHNGRAHLHVKAVSGASIWYAERNISLTVI